MAALAATAAPGGDGAASAAGASQDVDDDAPEIDNYVVAAAASVDELMSKDADDVELAAYKAKLLGLGAGGAPVQDDANDAKHVAVIELRLHFEDRDAPLIIPLSEESGGAEGDVATGAGGEPPVYVLKEGQDHRRELVFKVSREICLGLKFLQSVYRRGIRVDKEQIMVGSYPPKNELVVFSFPVDTVPSGMLARAKYQARIQVLDDDGNVHLKKSYHFKIAKSWS